MNPVHFTFKYGWIFLLTAAALILCSVFVQFGPDPVIAQWTSAPLMTLGHKVGLFLVGSGLLTILLFRMSERAGR